MKKAYHMCTDCPTDCPASLACVAGIAAFKFWCAGCDDLFVHLKGWATSIKVGSTDCVCRLPPEQGEINSKYYSGTLCGKCTIEHQRQMFEKAKLERGDQ